MNGSTTWNYTTLLNNFNMRTTTIHHTIKLHTPQGRYSTLPHITLHKSRLHKSKLHQSTLNCNTPHYIRALYAPTVNCTTAHQPLHTSTRYIIAHHNKAHRNTAQHTTAHYITARSSTLHYSTLQYTAFTLQHTTA